MKSKGRSHNKMLPAGMSHMAKTPRSVAVVAVVEVVERFESAVEIDDGEDEETVMSLWSVSGNRLDEGVIASDEEE